MTTIKSVKKSAVYNHKCYSTLFCLNRWTMPPVSAFTAPDFCSISLSRFSFRPSTVNHKYTWTETQRRF